MMEEDPYSMATPENIKAKVSRAEGEGLSSHSPTNSGMEEKLEEFQKSFSEEMRGIVGDLKNTVKKQGKEMEKESMELENQSTEIRRLRERMTELEKGKEDGGGYPRGENTEVLMGKVQELIVKKVEEKQEQARRICELRITGLMESEGETTTVLRNSVQEVFERKMQVEGAAGMLVDVFRIGKKGEDRFGRPRLVIARLGSVGQRNEILKAKRNLSEWKEIGVDVWRSKEEMEILKGELKKKREIEERGGRARLIK